MRSPEHHLLESTRRVIPIRQVHERRGVELAFLPAALEIVETPPSPVGRAIGAAIILLFCAALGWALWLSRHRRVGDRKIVPSSRTKEVQPFETGVVRSIRVRTRDGQGRRNLIELDPTVNAADRDHLQHEFMAEQLNVARLKAALAGGEDATADFAAPAGASPALIAAQRQLLLDQAIEHRAKIAALDRQRAKKKPSKPNRGRHRKAGGDNSGLQQRVDIRKTL